MSEPLVWWVLGALFSVLMLAGGAWLAALHGAVSGLQASAASQGERLAHVESRTTASDERLGRIENKIDRLIERLERS